MSDRRANRRPGGNASALPFYRSRFRRTAAFFLLLAFFCGLLPFTALAEEGRVIRVGFYPLENYHARDAKGNVVGYEVDYLGRIAEQTGWTYQFVETDSWMEAVDLLEQGRVDVVSPAQITEDRIARFLFSAMPIGKAYGAIMTLAANGTYVYEDFEAFSQMTFGIENGVSYNELFAEYARENGFTPKKIKTYRNSEALTEALNAGQIDAMVGNIMRIEDNMKLIGKFGTTAYYFMFRKDGTELERAFSDALYRIDLESPMYQNELNQRYFPVYAQQPLTKAEVEYVKTLPPFRIGCPVDVDPVSYQDPETGGVAGITRDILELAARRAGLSFEFVALPSGDVTYDLLRELDVDMVASVEKNGSNANAPGMFLSSPYLSSRKVVVGKKGVVYRRDAPLTVAVATGSQTLTQILKAQYDHFTIVRYPDNEACMNAITHGKADLMIQNQYVVQPLLAKPQFGELAVIPSEGIADELCLSPLVSRKKGEMDPLLSDRRLMTVLNKGIDSVTEEETSAILIAHTTNRPYPFVLKDFLYEYRSAIAILTASLFLLFCGGLYVVRLRRRSYLLLRSSENKLRNITSNINGGVVVLLPDEGMKITYANEGFLDLIQCPARQYREVMNASYVMYVHNEDVDVINRLIRENGGQSEKISVRVRIRRKDGQYIPTRFNGTITRNESGEVEMYCVIMDISQEVEMLEKLELEKRKQNLIVEKANEIIYEVDLEKKELHASEAFQRIFGWTADGQYQDLNGLAETWKIHSQDLPLVRDMIRTTLGEQTDASCTVRLLTREGGYKWFGIYQYVMQDRHSRLRFILGKIVDIDEQVREKRMLEKKSQTDAMTGLYNKETFLARAAQYLDESRDAGAAFLFMDLDGFKEINDRLGHVTGDQAICDAAKKLQVIFSGYDLIARFGGDEFCILIKEISRRTLEEKVSWALEKLRQTYTDGTHSASITASIGIAFTADCGFEMSVLLQSADKALYAVKEQGKNGYMIYYEGLQTQGYQGRIDQLPAEES